MRARPNRMLATAGLAGLALIVMTSGVLSAQTGTGQPPTGDAVFQQWCSTCHGDRGQGLTPEWRATWPPDHQNCSTRFCHGRDHLPWAAYIPNNTVPAVIGPNTLRRFDRPEELYAYTRVEMPLGWKGHLSREEYWSLTVFLLGQNGVEVDGRLPPAYPFPAWPAWKWRHVEGWN